MPNTCVVYGCKINYLTCKEKASTFDFPKCSELKDIWIKFVNRPVEENWIPTKNSKICANHFDEKYIKRCNVRNYIKWDLNPVPTIHTPEALKRPSQLPTSIIPRKKPKERVYQEDELEKYLEQDIIRSFDDFTEARCPPNYQFSKRDDCVIYYKLIFDEITSFPKAGGTDTIKSLKFLLEKGEISRDIIIMFDEMYLQKCTQYHGGTYEGANEEGELYKGVVVFMITGLKKSIPYVIKACPETSISGKWLAKHVEDAIVSLCDVGFNVKGIVADNHSANVSAYNYLLDKFPGDTSRLFMLHPDNNSRIYIFYDNVHLLKNIRNNLFNAKRFVFPELEILLNDEIRISIPNGYISWSDLHLLRLNIQREFKPAGRS